MEIGFFLNIYNQQGTLIDLVDVNGGPRATLSLQNYGHIVPAPLRRVYEDSAGFTSDVQNPFKGVF